MRAHGRTDGNQKQIVDQLRRCGYSVAITSSMGDGFPDLVVGAGSRNYMFEIKDPTKPLSQRKLTPDEILFQQKWNGQYAVIETVDDAIAIINGSNNFIQKHILK